MLSSARQNPDPDAARYPTNLGCTQRSGGKHTAKHAACADTAGQSSAAQCLRNWIYGNTAVILAPKPHDYSPDRCGSSIHDEAGRQDSR